MKQIKKVPLISIVIPTYKRHDKLNNLLDSIRKSNYPQSSLQIIIVDNASDLYKVHIKHTYPSAQIVKSGSNLYSNGARRLGTEYAKGDYIFHVDDDNILERDCLKLLVNAMENDKSIGVAGPLMLVDDTDTILSIGAKISSFGTVKYVEKNKKINEIKLPKVVYGFDYLHNAILIRREVLKNIAFDDLTFPHNWAETDFGFRVKSAGYSQVCIPQAIERHFGGYDSLLTRLGVYTTYDQAKSRILFRKRHMNTLLKWILFWIITFPASTLIYILTIVKMPENKLKIFKSYCKGTIDGIRGSVGSLRFPKIG